ncbi:MAG: hypothetical protein LBP35_02250 [Candidatus Ancillula trichonymphae]|nr:hypothetical protein [Candidatus Ancillula trichonymphae]
MSKIYKIDSDGKVTDSRDLYCEVDKVDKVDTGVWMIDSTKHEFFDFVNDKYFNLKIRTRVMRRYMEIVQLQCIASITVLKTAAMRAERQLVQQIENFQIVIYILVERKMLMIMHWTPMVTHCLDLTGQRLD